MSKQETDEGLEIARTFHTPPGEAKDWSLPLSPGKTWAAWHAWRDGQSTWVDGRIINNSGEEGFPLDIGCVGDSCCVDEAQGLASLTLWSNGSILLISHLRAPALILPYAYLTTASMQEALARAECDEITGNFLSCGSLFG